MRKHDEGYALALVLVVLVVLGLLVSIMLTFPLQHLQNQTQYVDRMQDQYTAAGEIEVVVGQLQTLMEGGSGTVNLENAVVNCEEKTVTITASCNAVKIECKVLLTADKIKTSMSQYDVTNLSAIQYISYEISNTGGDS